MKKQLQKMKVVLQQLQFLEKFTIQILPMQAVMLQARFLMALISYSLTYLLLLLIVMVPQPQYHCVFHVQK
jgi:hypothetical protein